MRESCKQEREKIEREVVGSALSREQLVCEIRDPPMPRLGASRSALSHSLSLSLSGGPRNTKYTYIYIYNLQCNIRPSIYRFSFSAIPRLFSPHFPYLHFV